MEPYRIRSPETWAKAREDYLDGMDAETVCRLYDLGLSCFRRRARKYGWRRIDMDDPSPSSPHMDLYDDLSLDDQVVMARQRFSQALTQGRAIEAARWRRLWTELKAERDAFDDRFFSGMTAQQRQTWLDAEARDRDALDALELGDLAHDDEAPEPEEAPEPAALASPPPENVHDVHSVFPDETPLSRAERRRREREARKRPPH